MNRPRERRAEILATLQREAAAAARRRQAMRRAGGACVLVLAAGALWVGVSSPAPQPTPIAQTDPRIVDTRVDLAAYTISDDELIAALDESGEAYTVVWVGGEARLLEMPAEEAPAPI